MSKQYSDSNLETVVYSSNGEQHSSSGKYMRLWRFNNVTGYWLLVKEIANETDAPKWLEIFQNTEPLDQFGYKNHFALSRQKPRKKPN